jgi:hypothetical protein
MTEVDAHRAKLAKWLRMTPLPTRLLAEGIATRLIPLFDEAGFREVSCLYGDSALKISGRETRLERWGPATIDSVHIVFDKYQRPRIAISLARRDRAEPLNIIRGGYLTTSTREYQSWWGKPWALPLSLWPARAPARVVDRLIAIAPQSLAFIDRGERGPNIGRSTEGIAY